MESTYNEILYIIDMKITDAHNKFIGVLLLDKKNSLCYDKFKTDKILCDKQQTLNFKIQDIEYELNRLSNNMKWFHNNVLELSAISRFLTDVIKLNEKIELTDKICCEICDEINEKYE